VSHNIVVVRLDIHDGARMVPSQSPGETQTACRENNSRPHNEGLITVYSLTWKLMKRFQRLLKQTLCLWTNRVIEIKLREYEVAERYDISVKA
jgi:hypothetical protein